MHCRWKPLLHIRDSEKYLTIEFILSAQPLETYIIILQSCHGFLTILFLIYLQVVLSKFVCISDTCRNLKFSLAMLCRFILS